MSAVTIAYKSWDLSVRCECVVQTPKSRSDDEDLYLFFWMLSQSDIVMEFQVRDGSGFVMLPSNFGWVCNKWVEKIKYVHE